MGTIHNHSITHVQHAMPVRCRLRVVCDHYDRLPEIFIQLSQKRQDRFGAFGVQISRWLVRKHDFRFTDDCARDGHALLLSTG